MMNKMMVQAPPTSQISFAVQPNYEEQIMNQSKNYVKIPSPGPPLMDGSYYRMDGSYLSYPPMVSSYFKEVREYFKIK
jgi:hypothetical protein